MARIAFYAPIKPPDHPIASGDRLIARNTMKALKQAGYDVYLASEYIAYSKREEDEFLAMRKQGALQEADRLIKQLWENPPDLWLTYHPYCKAPDWIGPRVCKEFQIPYVTLEAAKTGQGFENGQDRWGDWRREAQAGIKTADLHLVMKGSDRAYLKELLGSDAKLANLAPFIDTAGFETVAATPMPEHWRASAPVLVTVGMMRPGKKHKNYEILRDGLHPLQSLHWNLVIIGDGPERQSIEDMFSAFDADRIHWTGALEHRQVLQYLSAADLFVWPGWKEPIGMVYLEAQAMGLGIAALDSMGVPLTVRHGETGLLAPETKIGELSDNLSTLLSHPDLREDFSVAARKNIKTHHTIKAAAATFKTQIDRLLEAR